MLTLCVLTADGVSGAGLWHIPEGNAPLQQRAELHVQASRVRALAWHPERPDSAVTVEERSVVQWRFEGSSAEARPICALAAQKDSKDSLSDMIHSPQLGWKMGTAQACQAWCIEGLDRTMARRMHCRTAAVRRSLHSRR